MITAATLRSQTSKDLAQMAKSKGVQGWHSMRKDELVNALLRLARSKKKAKKTSASKKTPKNGAAKKKTSAKSISLKSASLKSSTSSKTSSKITRKKTAASNGKASNGKAAVNGNGRGKLKAKAPQPVKKTPKKAPSRKVQKENAAREKQRDLSNLSKPTNRTAPLKNGKSAHASNGRRNGHAGTRKDRVVLMVRDPFWLHVYWEISRTSVERCRAAMSEHWHGARPTLRLLELDQDGTTNTTERVARDIEIHGGVNNWYIDVKDPPKTYRVAIGYLAENGKFHALVRSNVVSTPRPGSADAIDENWSSVAENYEKVYAMSGGYEPDSAGGDLQELFEERLRRPMGSPLVTRYGVGAQGLNHRDRSFEFEVDAEMIIYGTTKPDSHVTLSGEPVRLRPDGTFTVRLNMPDRRQVLPVVANSADGVEQRTVVLAVERNTKVMEPRIRDATSNNAE